jgi:7-cyano-7-deazaguanine synthase in queuosine biosynthesis
MPLKLDYRSQEARNVNLALPRFTLDLISIPNRTLDLLEIAAYLYAADRKTPRGRADQLEYHAWSRRFRFRIKVRDADFWNQQEVGKALSSALTFLTGDSAFDFEFEEGHSTPPASLFDDTTPTRPDASRRSRVALFSGGLDSLSGVVDALATTSDRLFLVSHKSHSRTYRTQRALLDEMQCRYPNRIEHYAFECQLSGSRAVDETQRARSFLYCSIAYALAEAKDMREFFVYENGVTGINLRRREDLMAARASRTTHPRALHLIEELFGMIAGQRYTIHTPLREKTKADVIADLVRHGGEDLIPLSVSCSRSIAQAGTATHCGHCFQCIDRRLGMYAARAEDHDDPGKYAVDILREGMPSVEAQTTATDVLRQAARFVNMSADAFCEEYASDLADVVSAESTGAGELAVTDRVHNLMRRHGEAVGQALRLMREACDDPLRPLPPKSLLELAGRREFLRPDASLIAQHIVDVAQSVIRALFRSTPPKNENELNQKLGAILATSHKLRSELPVGVFACARVVPDHELPDAGVLVESKYIRRGTPPSKASEGIAADLTKYPRDRHLVFLVYDPGTEIRDDRAFIADFESRGRCTVAILR